jgi:hypothetical protein
LIDPLIWLVSQVGVDFDPVIGRTPLPVPQGREGQEWASTLITVKPSCDDGTTSCSFTSTMTFRFDLFYDNLPYTPNHGRAQVHSNF